MKSAEDRLREFQTQNNIATKGPLSLVIQFTRLVRDKEFLRFRYNALTDL